MCVCVYIYIYGSFLCIHSASLCLLVRAFNLFAFKVTIDLQVSIVIFPNWGLFLFATLKSYGNSKSKTTIDTHTQKKKKEFKHNSHHKRENKRGKEEKRPGKTNPEQLRK